DMTEWQTATPASHPSLRGVTLPEDRDTVSLVEHLRQRQIVEIRELRTGLEITTKSFVGSLSFGSLMLRVQPKLEAEFFAALVGYALGFLDIEMLPEHLARLSTPAF